MCALVPGEGDLFMPLHRQDMSAVEERYEQCVQWWAASPLVDAGLVVTRDADGEALEVLHGPVAPRSVACALELPCEGAIVVAPPGQLCVRGYVVFDAEGMPGAAAYRHIEDYLNTNGLAAVGDQVMHRLLRHRIVDGVSLRYDEVVVPVRRL